MKTQLETITPEIAARYLLFNTSNRPLRKSLVNLYARDMKDGYWRITHQGVAFDREGRLLDGQHRLAAIVQSGVTVEMLVTREVDSASQLVMDDHAKRSAGDALSLIRKNKVSATQVAVVRAAVELSKGRCGNADRFTNQELNACFDEFLQPLEFLTENITTFERGITSAPVQAAIVLAWYYVKDLSRLSVFCDILTGKSLPEGAGDRAAVVLREWLLRTGMQAGSARLEGFKKAQRAIVAFMDHREICKLYGTVTYYPWPLIDPVRR